MMNDQPTRQPITAILLLTLVAVTATAAEPGFRFGLLRTGDVVHDAGVSAGLAWGDYDDDGDPDLFITNWYNQVNFLYRNEGDGTFTRVMEGAIASDRGYSSGAAWGDYDNDGDLDLFVTNQQDEHNNLYRNDGDAGFVAVTSGDVVTDFGDSYSAAWADYDNDGLLDLVVSNTGQPNFVYHNEGGGSFRRLVPAGMEGNVGRSFGLSWGDYDDDGDLDLFVANYAEENDFLYRNDGHGGFERVMDTVVGSDTTPTAAGCWGDYDNDGDLDLYLANSSSFVFGKRDALYRNNGDGAFAEVSDSPVVTGERSSVNGSFNDVDLDGDLDLLVVYYADGLSLFLNDGTGTFEEYKERFPLQMAVFSTGYGWADFDLDGDLDLAVANWENQDNTVVVVRDVDNHWLRVALRGVRSNSRGIGATVRIAVAGEDGLRWQRRDLDAGAGFRSQRPAEATFGLGEAEQVAVVRVQWPSGQVDELHDVAADQRITITEAEGITASWRPQSGPSPVADALYQVLVDEGAEAARKRYDELRASSPDAYDYGEQATGRLVGRLYREDRMEETAAAMRMVADLFPESLEVLEDLILVMSLTGDDDGLVEAYRRTEQVLARSTGGDEDRRRRLTNAIGSWHKHRQPATEE